MPIDFSKVDLTGLPDQDKTQSNPSANMSEAVKVNPQQHARNMQLSKESGVPVFAVEGDPDSVESSLKFKNVDLSKLPQQSPGTAKFIGGSFDNAVLAQEDVGAEVLQGIERTFDGLGGTIGVGFKSAYEGLKLEMLEGMEGITRNLVNQIISDQLPEGDDRDAELSRAQDELSAVFTAEGGKILDEIKTLQAERRDLTPGDLNVVQEGVRAGLESVVQMIPGVAISAATGGSATPVLATMYAQTYASNYGDARSEGLDRDKAAQFANIGAVIEVATEALPLKTLQDMLTGKVKGQMTKKALTFAVQEMGTEQLATALETVNSYAHGLDEELEKATSAEEILAIQARRQAVTAVATIVGGGTQIATVSVLKKSIDKFAATETHAAAKAEADQEKLDKLAAGAESSQLRELNPEAFQQFIRDVDGDNNTTVFVDNVQASLYIQEKTSDEIAADRGLTALNDALETTRETGEDVAIPVDVFMSEVAGGTVFTEMREHLTLSPETVSPFRQEQYRAETAAYMDRMVDAADANAADHQTSQEIYDRVVKELVDTGMMSEANAKATATVLPAYVEARAQRLGLSVADTYAEMGLVTEGPRTGEMDRLNGDQVLTQMRGEPVQLDLLPPDPVDVSERLGKPSQDRRQSDVTVDQDKRLNDRRKDTARRERINAMTPEEQYAAIYGHELTGMNNRRAFEEDIDDASVVVSIDVDSLKTVNDNLGHDAGDNLLKVVASALNKHLGSDAYHISGDEFFVLGDDQQEIDKKIKAAQEDLKTAVISSNTGTMNGVSFTPGYGTDKESADHAMEAGKVEREKSGERVGRGEIPPTMTLSEKLNQHNVGHSGSSDLLTQLLVGHVNTPSFDVWFDDSVVVDDKGNPLTVYHGTGNTEDIFNRGFDPDITGQGMDQMGSGFYFTTDETEASGYETSITQNLQTDGVKLGGDTSPGTIKVHLSIQNPIVVKGDSLTDSGIELTQEQVVKILKFSEQSSHPEGSPFGDFFEEYWSEGARNWMYESVSGNYTGASFNSLENDFFHGEATNFRKALNEVLGYDGVVQEYENGKKHFVAWFPEQIKSVADRDNKHGGESDVDNLIVTHNLSAENIIAADRLGGLAAPSIATVRTDLSDFDNFGEVSLLADPSLLGSRKARTFDTDIYSPRQPYSEFTISRQGYNSFSESLDQEHASGLRPIDENDLRNGPDTLRNSSVVQYSWLKDQGKAPKAKNKKIDPIIRTAAKLELNDPKISNLAIKYFRKQAESIANAENGKVEDYLDMWFDENGDLPSRELRSFINKVRDFKTLGAVDYSQLKHDIDKKMRVKKTRDQFDEWVEDKFNDMVTGEKLFKGFTDLGNRKYSDYTMQNVLREMTRELQGGEQSFYGVGSVRSTHANELKTLKQVVANRNRIVSSEEMSQIKEDSSQMFDDLLDDLKKFYKYDSDSWSYMDDAGRAIMEGQSGLNNAFNLTPEIQKKIDDFVDYLTNLPTEYFETKIQRAVEFNEFNTAVVPKGVDKKALQILRDAGLKIKTYDPTGKGKTRKDVIAEQKKLLFQEARGYYDPNQSIIRLTEAADLSTWLHEFAHFMYEMELTQPSGMRDDIHNWYKRNADEVAAEANGYLGEDFGKLNQSPLIENRKREIGFEIEKLQVEFQSFGADIRNPERLEIKNKLEKLRDEFRSLSANEPVKYKPTDEQLNAEYDSPYDVPKSVMEWAVSNLSIIESDASSDLTRFARIYDTVNDDRMDEGDVTVYRAVTSGDEIRPGDWVTTDRAYAESHLANIEGEGFILEEVVDGKDVLLSPTGNSEESIYAPLPLSEAIEDEQTESPELLAQPGVPNSSDLSVAGDTVSGLTVTDNIPNRSSIGSSLEDYEILTGVREVPMSVFESMTVHDLFYASGDHKRVRNLAEQIKSNEYLDPLIIVEDSKGYYVLEGGHRLGAAITLGLESVPALVVRDIGDLQLNQSNGTPSGNSQGSITPEKVIQFLDLGTTGDEKKDAALRRAVHEQFARGFETYLMEGEAPSAELRNVFRTFARWLTQIYKSVRGNLNVNLDNQMREVFDRLLATEEQLAAAEARARVEPMFTDAAMAGMTEEQFTKYQEQQQKAKDVQNETLRDKLIKDLTRKSKKWWKEEKADIVVEETERLKTEKVYTAVETLRDTDLKLDTATVKEMVGEERTNKLGNTATHVPGKLRGMTAKGQAGVHPDEAAAFLGYDSGAELMADIIAAPTLREAADDAAEAVMVERHGDIFNDGTIEQAADDIVRDEERGKVILTELKALNKSTSTKSLDRQAMKDMAKDRIAGLTFREIQPAKYHKAEILAAQESSRLLAEGDKQGAADAKMRQMLNHFLGREAAEAKADVMKTVDFMTRYRKKKVRENIQKAGNQYWEQLDKILSRFEFRKGASLTQVDQTNSDINTWMTDQMENHGAGLVLSNVVLNESYVTHWKNVPYGDLKGISDSVKNIEHVAKYSDKLKAMGEEIEYNKLVTKLTDAAAKKGKNGFKKSASTADDLGWIESKGRWAMAQMTKIPFMMRWMDGVESNGVWFETFSQPFTEALDAKFDMFKEVGQPVMDMIKNRDKKDIKRHNTKVFIPEIKGTGGGTHTGNMMGHEIIAVALNVGNESNLRKLLLGEGWADPNDESTISLDNPQLQAVLAHMTESDWQMVQTIWDQIDILYPQLAEVHRRTTGLTPPKVERTPVETPYGTFSGGYYPVKYDPARDAKAAENEARNDAETASMFSGGASIQANVTAGAANERTGYYAPIHLTLDVIPNHINETIHYITHHDAVRSVNRLLRDQRIKEAVTAKLGPEEFAQLKPWLNDIAKDGRNAPIASFVDRAFNQLRLGTTLGVMGFKASTGIIQISGLSNTVAEVGISPVMQAARTILGSPSTMQSAWEFASTKSKVLKHRTTTMDREIMNAMKDLSGKRGKLAMVQEASMKHIAYIQTYMVDLPSWHAAYIKELGESGDEKKAIKYADWVIENVQGSGATKDMAALMRNQSKTHTIFTMFMTFFSALWNLQRDTARGKSEGVYSTSTVSAKLMFLITVPVLFEMMMRGELGGEDEEPEETIQSVLTKVAMFPVQSVPFFRDIVNGVFGGYGYNASPVTSQIEKGLQGLAGMTENDATLSEVKNASKLVGATLGVPGTGQAWASGEHLYDVLENGEDFDLHQLLFGPKRD